MNLLLGINFIILFKSSFPKYLYPIKGPITVPTIAAFVSVSPPKEHI